MGVRESTSGRKIRKKEDSRIYAIETERDREERNERDKKEKKNGMVVKVL